MWVCLLLAYGVGKMDGVALMCFNSWQQSKQWFVCLLLVFFGDNEVRWNALLEEFNEEVRDKGYQKGHLVDKINI
jgi:hypothetical protein